MSVTRQEIQPHCTGSPSSRDCHGVHGEGKNASTRRYFDGGVRGHCWPAFEGFVAHAVQAAKKSNHLVQLEFS